MKDNEEALVYHQDSLVIDQLRNAHSFKRMSQQRTLHALRTDGKDNLSDWFAGKLDEYLFRNLGGDTTMSHGQAAVAADTDHYIVTGDVAHSGVIATDEASLGSNDQIALADFDYAKEKATTITPPMRPAMIEGEDYFVGVIHPYSVTDLRLNVSASTYIKWSDIQMYANTRGLKNPIFTGSLGVYNKMIFFEASRIYSPVANVRRNLLLGSQAGVFALGNAYDKIDQRTYGKDNLLTWNEERDDYGNEKGISAGMIFGLKNVYYNSKYFGTMNISSYAVVHN
ncbi:MAG: N4-gp56 family major capsid protein [Bacteroidetes bacterium]|nr:N4-gp56 family major capsid protein [Bacteroidota bacterium]